MKLRAQISRLPLVRPLAVRYRYYRITRSFPGSAHYWEQRYRSGGNSGAGSYNRLAHFKAETVNAFVREKSVATVIEFGCGDGNQLKLAHYPRYVGVDIAPWAIEHCRLIFKDDSSKQFSLPDNTPARSAELALSLDVIYHLVEDDVFHHYMEKLCDSASRYIIIYSSNTETYNYKFQDPHVRHRCFSDWIKQHRPQWKLLRHLPHPFPYKPEDAQNTSLSEFFFYEKKA